jgi:hypothetical protein
MHKHLAQLIDLGAQLQVTRLRLLLDALEPPLDVITVGYQQLELEVLEVSGRISLC